MFRSLCDFYGCMRLPFDKSLPVRDLFPATAHQEIQARLAFAVQNHFPALVTGDVGSGKSTAVRAFIQSLDPNLYLTAYLPNPNLTIQALFAYILAAANRLRLEARQPILPSPWTRRTPPQHPL